MLIGVIAEGSIAQPLHNTFSAMKQPCQSLKNVYNTPCDFFKKELIDNCDNSHLGYSSSYNIFMKNSFFVLTDYT